VFINFYCFIDAGERVEIGNNVLIGPYVYITDGDHGMDPSSMRITQPMSLAPVIIEDGVWIGARASILKGVKIGRNAVIGAGAVVTRSVEENDVAAGVPAKSIRKTHN
jgi:maltose O-acetyltransferase